jgi:peptidoglycan/xylan/chitin deacetylase (PgdA/CDA1 family)
MRPRSPAAILSQLYHLVVYSLDRRRSPLGAAALIISVDVDVGCKLVGERNESWRAHASLGRDSERVNSRLSESKVGEIEGMVVPRLVHLFEEMEIPATFAIRGQYTETDGSLYELIKRSSVRHDIGAHGYYHRSFTSLSCLEAEDELRKISIGMNRFSLKPRSFVFPKNKVAHLNLLEKYGYKCYRGYGDFRSDGMNVSRNGNLYDVHPSFFLGSTPYSVFLNRMVDVAIKYRCPFHIWFHPSDFGFDVQSVDRKIHQTLQPLLKYAREKNHRGELDCETMCSVVEKLERQRHENASN